MTSEINKDDGFNLIYQVDYDCCEFSIFSLDEIPEEDFIDFFLQNSGSEIPDIINYDDYSCMSLGETEIDSSDFTFDYSIDDEDDFELQAYGLEEFIERMEGLPQTSINILTSKTGEANELVLEFVKKLQNKYPKIAFMQGEVGMGLFWFGEEIQKLYVESLMNQQRRL